MTGNQKAEYIINNGWRIMPNVFNSKGENLWIHMNCYYSCRIDVAYEIQKMRDDYSNKLAWYKKLYKKIFKF